MNKSSLIKVRPGFMVVIASCAAAFVLTVHGANNTVACDTKAPENTNDVCYVDVHVDLANNVATVASNQVTFYKDRGNKVTIVWRVDNPDSNYAFRADALWLAFNSDTQAFDKPACQTATPDKPDPQHCEQNVLQGQIYFIWQVKKLDKYNATLEYKLKLYPLNKDSTRTIDVKTRVINKLDDTAIWVDPTVVIQG